MDKNRPPESVELVTEGMVPVQFFVVEAIPLPPGTPAQARPDRPPFVEKNEVPRPEGAPPELEGEGEP